MNATDEACKDDDEPVIVIKHKPDEVSIVKDEPEEVEEDDSRDVSRDVPVVEKPRTRQDKEHVMMELKSMVWQPPGSTGKRNSNGVSTETYNTRRGYKAHLDIEETRPRYGEFKMVEEDSEPCDNGDESRESHRVPEDENGFLHESPRVLCATAGCQDMRSHFHCTLCEFVTNKVRK